MKVLYYGWQRTNYPLLKKMQENYGWNPAVIAANNTEKEKALRDFPKSTYITIPELRFGNCDYSQLKKIPIGEEEYKKIGVNFVSYLNYFNKDTSGHNFSTRQKIYFAKKIFDYWNTILSSIKIDCIVFSTWPHTSTCYSLYLISKFVFKKKILFVDMVEHFNKFYHTVGYTLEDFSTPYLKYVNENHQIKDVDDYINNIKSNKTNSKNIKVDFLRSDTLRFRETMVRKYHVIRILINLIISIFKGGLFRSSNEEWKFNKKPFDKSNSVSITRMVFFRLSVCIKTMFLKAFYKKNTSKINSKNYILFCAQYQPEAQTTQLNGYYQDVFAILDLIYSSKDENTDVYYKEHPATLETISVYNSTLFRDKNYWKKLLSYKNLKLVDLKTKVSECIDDSIAVATMNSTAGIESLIYGKPVLLFGKSWYSSCNGVFKIDNYEKCKNAMKEIKDGFKPDENKVKAYLNSVALSCDKDIKHDRIYKRSDVEDKEFIDKISYLLHKKYKEYYQ
mgnify:CR=1 FL=1|tara:strand:+ start:12231 stop:13745 length:1515 start_codon:yes stop_codon:yes gene_type:complete